MKEQTPTRGFFFFFGTLEGPEDGLFFTYLLLPPFPLRMKDDEYDDGSGVAVVELRMM